MVWSTLYVSNTVSSTCLFVLLQAFDVVEKSYFETIDDALAEKAHLSNYAQPHNEVYTQKHKLFKAYREIKQKIEKRSSLSVSVATTDLCISLS